MDVHSVYTNRRMIQTDTVIRVHPVHADLFAIRREATPTVVSSDGPLSLPEPRVVATEFLVDRANLDALIAGEDDYTVAPGLGLFQPSFRETVRTQGWPSGGNLFTTLPPYTTLVDGGATADDIIRVCLDTHMIFDAFGAVLPVSLVFDYINGDIRERSFDLPKLAAHLLSRDDVVVYAKENSRWDRKTERPRAASVTDAIERIPVYNAGPGSNETITFRWIPDVASYRRLWEHCLKAGGKYPSTRLRDGVFALDLLGITAAGCKIDRVYEDED